MAILQRSPNVTVADSAHNSLTSLAASDLIDLDYYVEVNGLLVATFASLTGGEMEIDVFTHDIVYPSGESTTLMIPGPTSFAPINLSRGLGNSVELFNWFAAASAGDIIQARRNGRIVLKKKTRPDATSTTWTYDPVIQWNFEGAWLSKISGFSSNAYQGSKAANLSITIVPELIERISPPD